MMHIIEYVASYNHIVTHYLRIDDDLFFKRSFLMETLKRYVSVQTHPYLVSYKID